MWSAADNTEGAGGFLDSTYNGETTQSAKPDTIRGNAIVPLMIGHLIDGPLDTLKLWGTEIKLIQLVAYVRDVQRVTTKISYELVDETGSVMAIQWIEDGNSKGPATVPVGSYARVIGSHRETAGKAHVFVLKIVPVTKMMEVFEHLLEVTYLCLKGKEIFTVGEDAPAVTDDADNDGCQGMNKDQALVFKIIKSENDSESGIEKSSLRMKLPNNVRDKLDEILEFLVCEGHIYTTCTDDHFKTTSTDCAQSWGPPARDMFYAGYNNMMQRSQLRDVPSWMARLLPEPFEGFNKADTFKMFGSRTVATATSTFYTDLEETLENDNGPNNDDVAITKSRSSVDFQSLERRSATSEDANSQDSDSVVGSEEQQQEYSSHSFHRIASFSGFPRFQPFVMSASSPAECTNSGERFEETTTSIVQMSHSVLECRSSRYAATKRTSNQYTVDSYAVSESESDDESEETRSSETESVSATDRRDDDTVRESKTTSQNESSSAINRRKRAQRVAEELLATEKKYVNILHLIDQVFQFRVDQENRAHPMFPPETVQHMFSNIKSIYKFHNDFLLPQLEERMACWNTNSRIGDIMKNFAPFLKMYTEYVKNFDYAMNLIHTLQHKVTRFAAIINDIQKLDECAKLSLSHHMLSPIQRLPRYELLLKDYLRNLKDDHPDYEDTRKALELVSTAANHTNEAMKKIDKFKKLLEIQESIYDATDLVSATRELIKEGRIVKISARSGDHQERYLFLFSDMLLLCSMRLIPGPLYRLRAKFLIENIELVEGDNLETANTFYIRDANKSVELYTHGTAEKAAWLDALFQTMQEIMRRKASLKTGNNETALVKADDVTRCMVCEAIFSVMKRKHNCRACGIVVCSKCSNQKLLFEDNKNMRVCRLCHAALTQPLAKSPTSPSGPVPSLLQVSACDPCVLSGFLYLKTQASKPWTRRWFALHADFVLYTFKSDTDRLALTATPMPGFTLTEGTKLGDDDPLNIRDRKGTFKIHHSRKYYYLQAHSQEESDIWLHTLELATKAELPHPVISAIEDKEEKNLEDEDAQQAQSIAHAN